MISCLHFSFPTNRLLFFSSAFFLLIPFFLFLFLFRLFFPAATSLLQFYLPVFSCITQSFTLHPSLFPPLSHFRFNTSFTSSPQNLCEGIFDSCIPQTFSSTIFIPNVTHLPLESASRIQIYLSTLKPVLYPPSLSFDVAPSFSSPSPSNFCFPGRS